MHNVTLKHNPYTCENEITINGEKNNGNRVHIHVGNQRICKWISGFFHELCEMLNDRDIKVSFIGRRQDYEDLLEEAKLYNNLNNTNIDVVFDESSIEKDDADRIHELKELCQYAKDGPVDDLKGDKIYKKFDEITNPKFSATVVATMSSGKSTLINALLGHEILPARNEATTATITEIIDVNEGDESYKGKKYSAQAIDEDGNDLATMQEISKKDLEEWNDNEKVHKIIIRGPIPEIDIKGLEFSIFDTPGPNNSANEDHENTTNKSLKNDPHSMVFYVLNGTQFQVKDDKHLLSEVSRQMLEEGRQSHDRFIFVANKMDAYDPEKGESVHSAIEKIETYLEEKFGIIKPIVVPVSAHLAKIIRCKRDNPESLSKAEKAEISSKVSLYSENEYNFNTSAKNISRVIKSKIDDRIKKSQGDEDELALIHSGIPLLEVIVDDYINKYAIPCKIKDAKDALDEGIGLAKHQQDLKKKLGENDEERKEFNKRILETQKRMQRGEEAKKFRKQIENLSEKNTKASQRIHEETGAIRAEFRKIIDDSPKTVEEYEMGRIINKMQGRADKSFQRIKSCFDALLPEIRKGQYEEIRQEYVAYVKDLFGGDDKNISAILDESAYRFEESFNFEIHEYKTVSKRKKVGTKSADVDWVDWCTLGISRFFKDDIPTYKTETKVNVQSTLSKPQQELETWLVRTEKLFDEQVKTEIAKIKQECLQGLDGLDDKLKEFLGDIAADTASKETLERAIEEGNVRIAWINDFQQRLNKVIAIG